MNPIAGFFRTLFLFLTGKIHYDQAVKGKPLTMPDGETFTIFRRVEIQSKQPEPQAYFWVRFKPMNMGIQANIHFSLIPMMIFMGFSGFRSKYWGVNMQTGLCQGLYEWQTVEDAREYVQSIAMRFMTRRSDPASISYGIVEKAVEPFDFHIE